MVYEALLQESKDEESSEMTVTDDPINHFRNHSKRSSIRSQILPHWLSILNVTLFLFQLVLGILYLKDGSLINSLTAGVQYGRDYDYMTLDHEYDALWEGHAVDTGGYIILSEHGGPYSEIEYGAVSMFHQLHCLRSFRTALQHAREGQYVAMDWKTDRHWPHCLWYLRQTILCAADGFIERETEFNGTSGFIDGADDFRKCGDKESLYKLFAEKDASKYDADK